MTIQEWGALGELIGGMAIIISLIYVGYQIRQSNNLAKAESMRDISDMSAYNQLMARNPDLGDLVAKGYRDFSSLSTSEQRTFHHVVSLLIDAADNVYRQYQYGYVRSESMENRITSIAMLVATPGAAQWWSTSKFVHASDFVTAIEQTTAEKNINSETFFANWPYYDVDVEK